MRYCKRIRELFAVLIIITMVIATMSYGVPVLGASYVGLEEDFEGVAIDGKPSSFTMKYNGTATSNQKVMSYVGRDGSPTKAFRLQGASGWAAEFIHKLQGDFDDFLIIEADVMPVEGKWPGRFGLWNAKGSWGTRVNGVLFRQGKIEALRNGNDSDRVEIGSYVDGQWYHVMMICDITNKTYDVYIDGELKVEGLGFHPSVEPTYLNLTSGNSGRNEIVYDNISLRSLDATPSALAPDVLEDFERYVPGTYPSSFYLKHNGTGTNNQRVGLDSGPEGKSTKVLMLQGALGWASENIRDLDKPLSDRIIIEVKMKPVSGNSPGTVGLYNNHESNINARVNCVSFHEGQIIAMNQGRYDQWSTVGSYNLGQWYSLKLDHNLLNKTYDVYLDGALMAEGLTMHPSVLPTHMDLAAGNTQINDLYVDDVKMSFETITAPEGTLISEFRFDGSIEDNLGVSTLTVQNVLDSSFGHDLGAGKDITYWAYKSGSNPGGGFYVDVPKDLKGSYTVALKASFDQLGAGYKKVMDFKNQGSDNGLYYYYNKLKFYGPGNSGSTGVTAGEVVDIVLVRDGIKEEVTVYLVKDGVILDDFAFDDSKGYALPQIVEGQSRMGFLFDDATNGHEYCPSGKVYGLRIYDGVISTEMIGDLLTPEEQEEPPNKPPVAVDDDGFTTAYMTPITVKVIENDMDPDGDRLQVVEVDLRDITQGQVTHDGSDITYKPADGFSGVALIDYGIEDKEGLSDRATLTVEVLEPVNLPPIAGNDNGTTGAALMLVLDVLDNDTDPDGDTLSIGELTNLPEDGTVISVVGQKIHFASDKDTSGMVTFDYQVNDGQGGSDIGQVSVMVLAMEEVAEETETPETPPEEPEGEEEPEPAPEEPEDEEDSEETEEPVAPVSASSKKKTTKVYYRLNLSSTEGGNAGAFEGNRKFAKGTLVSVEPEAEEGFEFMGFEGDTDSITGKKIKMTGDLELIAVFEPTVKEVAVDDAEVPEASPETEEDKETVEPMAIEGALDQEVVIEEAELPKTSGLPLVLNLLIGGLMLMIGLVKRYR